MAPLKGRSFSPENGQAITEYLLLLAILVSFFVMLSQGLANAQLMSAIMQPITTAYAKAYQNGHYQASAPDDPGGAFKHPRATGPQSFRIFYSTGSN